MSDNSWPAWYYGPKGAKEIFHSEDEVPSGWKDHPSKVKGSVREEVVDEIVDEVNEQVQEQVQETVEETVAKKLPTADELAEAYGQDELIAKIDEANKTREGDDEIEYLGNWSKVKLAQALLDAEVEVTLPEDKE